MATGPWNSIVQHLRTVALPVRDEITDADLLESFVLQGNPEALTALVQRHGPLVWNVCRRLLRKPQDAEDAFQATFLVLVRKATTIRCRERCAHWLYRVAYQTALKARAVAARRSVREQQVTDMPEPIVTQPDLGNDLRLLLDRELNRLPEKYGAVLVLCDLKGKTRPEAARQLGWPEGTVAGRLARARAMLAKRLSRHGLALSATALAAVLPSTMASANVPPSVISSTIEAATLVAAGQAAEGVISPTVTALTEGVLRNMLMTKLKTVAFVVVLVVLVGGCLTAVAQTLSKEGTTLAGEETSAKAPVGQGNNGDEPKVRGDQMEPQARYTLNKHSEAVMSVAFSPDGKTLASGSQDGTAKLWNVATGKERATLKGHSCLSVAFSPDGKTLASAIIGSPTAQEVVVKLWDVTTGTERAALKGNSVCPDGLWTVAFSPDGKTLASATADGTIKLWDVATGNEQATLQVHAYYLAFSPDGKTLAWTSGDEIELWDVATGKERATLQGHTGFVRSVAYSPDGKTLASASDDKTIKLWDVATGKQRATLQGHTNEVMSVAYSPDGKTLASAGHDKTIRLYEVATGKQRATLLAHAAPVRSVAYSPDGKTLASASEDKTIRLWDVPLTKKAESARSTILAPENQDGLWTTLAGEDAEKAYQAIGTLVGANDQAVLLVKGRLRPAPEPNVQQITRWITALDSDQFAVRQKAIEELEKLGEQVVSALRTKLAERPSLEVRQRIEQLLSKIEQEPLSPDAIRTLRAVEVLENIGSSEAKKVLETLATGAEGFRLAREAKASLERLNKRVVAEK
jgi:RNA polymerase sigma factor (sigma-70 family)